MASRRGLLKGLLFLGGAAVIMARPWSRGGDKVVLRPLEGLAPFRHLVTDAVDISGGGSATNAAFLGIAVPGPSADADAEALERMRGNVAREVLADWQADGPLPITYFTDIQCPLCPAFEAQVYELAAQIGVTPVARELPLLPGSEGAARLALAAEALRPGLGRDVRDAIRAARAATLPEPRMRSVLADVADLDVDAVYAARDRAELTSRLSDDRAMADVLQIPGTPSAVIGRTIIVGRVPSVTLRAIVEVERAEGPPETL